MFVAGPPVVNRASASSRQGRAGRLGDPDARGAMDQAVDSEEEAFARARRFLSYLPSSVDDAPPRGPQTDDPARREEILFGASRATPQGLSNAADHRDRSSTRAPSSRWAGSRALDHHRLRPDRRLAGRGYGERSVFLRRRLDGRYLPEGRRASWTWPRPSICRSCIWWDCPGFQIGLEAETCGDDPAWCAGDGRGESGDRSLGVPSLSATASAWPARCISRPVRFAMRYAWLSPPAGAPCRSRAGSRRPIARRSRLPPIPQAKLQEIEQRLIQLRAPSRTAESFWVEELIDPRDTRKILCHFGKLAEPLRRRGPRAFGMRP